MVLIAFSVCVSIRDLFPHPAVPSVSSIVLGSQRTLCGRSLNDAWISAQGVAALCSLWTEMGLRGGTWKGMEAAGRASAIWGSPVGFHRTFDVEESWKGIKETSLLLLLGHLPAVWLWEQGYSWPELPCRVMWRFNKAINGDAVHLRV